MLLLSLLCKSSCNLGKCQCMPAAQKDGTGYWVWPRKSWSFWQIMAKTLWEDRQLRGIESAKFLSTCKVPSARCCGLNIQATFMSSYEWSMRVRWKSFFLHCPCFLFHGLDEAPFLGQFQQDRWISGIYLGTQCQEKKKSIFNNSFLIYFLCPCSEYPRSPRAAQRHGSSKSLALNAITCCLLLGS